MNANDKAALIWIFGPFIIVFAACLLGLMVDFIDFRKSLRK